jgi:hypothetical protein
MARIATKEKKTQKAVRRRDSAAGGAAAGIASAPCSVARSAPVGTEAAFPDGSRHRRRLNPAAGAETATPHSGQKLSPGINCAEQRVQRALGMGHLH